jgi:hypothetical protein
MAAIHSDEFKRDAVRIATTIGYLSPVTFEMRAGLA